VTSWETLRPLGYSVVADLIHHVRNELPIDQLAKVVYIFSCNLNDPTFTSSIQTMCAKLLNTIVDSIQNRGEAGEANRLLRGMFISSLEKLVAMTDAYDKIKAIHLRDKSKGQPDTDGDAVMELDAAAQKQLYGWKEIEVGLPVHAVAFANDTLESFCKGASGYRSS
jgi:transformation/transcription domain-associated protein